MSKESLNKIYRNFGRKIKRLLLQPVRYKYVRSLPLKVEKMRSKDKINVLFVLYELGSWKTESLYLRMLLHPRFNPQLVLVPEVYATYPYDIMKNYLEEKKYTYSTMGKGETIQAKFHPDIIFYQKPYEGIIEKKFFFLKNLSSLFCHVGYCFRNRNIPNRWISYIDFIWQNYAENQIILKEKNYPKNMINTGMPFMDDLLKEKSCYHNPWKQHPAKKICIIYAPHHTIYTEQIKSTSPFDYSTFLEYADFMLEMADKYKDSVQWAFKPHPLLKRKLYKIWGNEKTDAYYQKWGDMENSQIEEGEYMGLFKYSDAMIHDSASFKLEYLYAGNPVMYLDKNDQEFDYPNWQTQEALKLHYHGQSKEDIEKFIQDVISGKDPLKEQRDHFVHAYLTPPHGKSACENIINAILGEAEYA